METHIWRPGLSKNWLKKKLEKADYMKDPYKMI